MDIDISPYLDGLAQVYAAIDREYDRASGHYGNFSCEGCTDNCCVTVFYHYTLVENLYLIEGLEELHADLKQEIIPRAQAYIAALAKRPLEQETLSIMCPANFEEKCVVYKHRPLICRIHGLPGVLNSPKGKQQWEGCLRFREMHGDTIDYQINRTEFYTTIATIERDLRKELVFTQKHKKTIADMIVDQTKDEITLIKKMGPEDFHKDSHII